MRIMDYELWILDDAYCLPPTGYWMLLSFEFWVLSFEFV